MGLQTMGSLRVHLMASWMAQPMEGELNATAAMMLMTVPHANCEICSAVMHGATRSTERRKLGTLVRQK